MRLVYYVILNRDGLNNLIIDSLFKNALQWVIYEDRFVNGEGCISESACENMLCIWQRTNLFGCTVDLFQWEN